MLSRFSLVRATGLACLLVVLPGCTTRGAAEGKVVLSYTRWGDPAEMESTRELIAHFESENPDILVNVDVVSWEQYWQKMKTATATGTAQDVWLMSPAYVEEYAGAGYLLDLMPFIRNDPTFNEDDYYEGCFDAFSFVGTGNEMRRVPFGQGQLYAFTRDYNCRLLYYNRDHFDAQGLAYPNDEWTWDDLVRAAKRLTIDFDGDGVIDQWGYGGLEYTAFAGVNGAEPMRPTKPGVNYQKDYRSNYRSTPMVEAIRFCRDLIHRYHVHPPPTVQLGEGDRFVTGKVSMAVAGVWCIRRYNASKYLWDIARIPTDVKGRKRSFVGGGVAHCIYSGTRHPAEAYKLVKFLSSERSQKELAKSGTSVPVLKAARHWKEFLEPFDRPPKSSYHVIWESLSGRPRGVRFTKGYLEYSTARRRILEGVWRGNRSPEEACRMIDTETDRIIAEKYGLDQP